jgi:hypothetical protein
LIGIDALERALSLCSILIGRPAVDGGRGRAERGRLASSSREGKL